ncbi:MAG: SDR family NAD(P)-dependent oxidoreductase [Pseudomonadota bacterium]
MNTIDLQGQKAIVTGGAQGIGRAVAERFIASGAFVTIWDVDRALSEQTVASLGEENCSHISVDLTDWDAVRSAAARSEAEMGRVDILINNAGIAGANATVADTDPAEWRRVIDLDLNGVFYCAKAVVPMMVAQGYGRIVNTASIAGKEGNPNAAHYSAAKAGVIALTKSLGKELAAHDIAVNCITPAAAKTAIFDQISQTHIDYMLSKIPRGRFVTVEEIAAMVAWLSSAENSFTTGGVFDLSGGRATY